LRAPLDFYAMYNPAYGVRCEDETIRIEQVPKDEVVEFFANVAACDSQWPGDGRPDVSSLSKIKYAMACIAPFKLYRGIEGYFETSVLSVSNMLAAQVICSITMFSRNETLDVVDSKIDMAIKNCHTVNLQMHTIVRDNTLVDTANYCKYFIRFVRLEQLRECPLPKEEHPSR